MKKRMQKLTIARETVRSLQAHELANAGGAQAANSGAGKCWSEINGCPITWVGCSHDCYTFEGCP